MEFTKSMMDTWVWSHPNLYFHDNTFWYTSMPDGWHVQQTLSAYCWISALRLAYWWSMSNPCHRCSPRSKPFTTITVDSDKKKQSIQLLSATSIGGNRLGRYYDPPRGVTSNFRTRQIIQMAHLGLFVLYQALHRPSLYQIQARSFAAAGP